MEEVVGEGTLLLRDPMPRGHRVLLLLLLEKGWMGKSFPGNPGHAPFLPTLPLSQGGSRVTLGTLLPMMTIRFPDPFLLPSSGLAEVLRRSRSRRRDGDGGGWLERDDDLCPAATAAAVRR